MDVNKIFKYVNNVEIKKEEVEATPESQEVTQDELMAKIMEQMNAIQDEKEALLKQLEEAETKQRDIKAERSAEDTLEAISKALNIPSNES